MGEHDGSSSKVNVHGMDQSWKLRMRKFQRYECQVAYTHTHTQKQWQKANINGKKDNGKRKNA